MTTTYVNEDLFLKTFNASPGLFAISGFDDGKHYAVSERWIATLGYSREEAIGKTAFELNLWVNLEDRKKIIACINKEDRIRDYPTQLRAKDGTIYDLAISGERVQLDDKDRLMLVANNVTDLNRANSELENFNAELSVRISKSTASLLQEIEERKWTEKELKRAWAEAEAANNAKSNFLAHMSHELRTPLNAIIGFSDALKSGIFGDLANAKQGDYIESIHTSGAHLLELINDLLDLSVIEAGELELQRNTFDLSACWSSCRTLVLPMAEARGVALLSTLPDDLPRLHADEKRIRQVVINLLSNAVKASPAGSTVIVNAGILDTGSMWIDITDQGIGIAPKDIESVLRPFGRVKNNAYNQQQGTGLGLPLSQKLVEALDGTLTIESELSVGTTVRLLFPAKHIAR